MGARDVEGGISEGGGDGGEGGEGGGEGGGGGALNTYTDPELDLICYRHRRRAAPINAVSPYKETENRNTSSAAASLAWSLDCCVNVPPSVLERVNTYTEPEFDLDLLSSSPIMPNQRRVAVQRNGNTEIISSSSIAPSVEFRLLCFSNVPPGLERVNTYTEPEFYYYRRLQQLQSTPYRRIKKRKYRNDHWASYHARGV